VSKKLNFAGFWAHFVVLEPEFTMCFLIFLEIMCKTQLKNPEKRVNLNATLHFGKVRKASVFPENGIVRNQFFKRYRLIAVNFNPGVERIFHCF